MGIYDRDYVRRGGTGNFGGGFMPTGGLRQTMRAWSMNTWIIAICVAVFLLDTALWNAGIAIQVKGAQFFDANSTSAQRDGATPARDANGELIERYTQGVRYLPLVDSRGLEVGRQEVSYMPPLRAALHFSTGKAFFQLEIWRLIGFQFLHGSFGHLLFNMLGLFFFGGLVEGYLGSKRYLAFYLICGMFGAVAYLLLNLIGFLGIAYLHVKLPGALAVDIFTPLIGASAGVFGVLMAVGFLAPNTTILLFFLIPMRVRTAAYGMVAYAVLDVFLFESLNAGGSAAHIGGAIAGYYFIRHTHLLRDFLNFFGFGDRPPKSKSKGAKRLKAKKAPRGTPDTSEVDRILDKVNDSGLHSLTDKERRTLRQATESRR